tara:strand:+ start:40 stop:735 length:696 start_codon:yes stop_codon:yes gene_type:complete
MAYYLGKDVNVYWTTEHERFVVSGTANEGTTGSSLEASQGGSGAPNSDITGGLLYNRSEGITANTLLSDITGVDFTPGAMNEDISFMGKNTNLSAKVKNEFSISLTKKKNDTVWDRLFNDRGRDGVYTTVGGTITADASGSSATGVIHDGLTTSRMQNFGYRVFLELKDGAEIFVIRNCCITGHTVSLNADGTQEETLELYSYVNPAIVTGATTGGIQRTTVTGATALASI